MQLRGQAEDRWLCLRHSSARHNCVESSSVSACRRVASYYTIRKQTRLRGGDAGTYHGLKQYTTMSQLHLEAFRVSIDAPHVLDHATPDLAVLVK